MIVVALNLSSTRTLVLTFQLFGPLWHPDKPALSVMPLPTSTPLLPQLHCVSLLGSSWLALSHCHLGPPHNINLSCTQGITSSQQPPTSQHSRLLSCLSKGERIPTQVLKELILYILNIRIHAALYYNIVCYIIYINCCPQRLHHFPRTQIHMRQL